MAISDRRLAVLGGLALLSLLDVAFVGARMLESGSNTYVFLAWNIFLAWIPLVLAMAVYDGFRRHGARLRLLPPAVGWLLFLPNAPYILTDFVHLGPSPRIPLWYDAAMISAFAFTGLVLGLVSLALVHVVLQRIAGATWAWLAAALSLLLASVGIYIGRFLNLNSWDALLRPRLIAGLIRVRLEDPFGNFRLLAVTMVFSAFLGACYLLVHALARPAVELDRGSVGRRR
ncbi:MAG: DUF1361 domain-containing protein [Gaiellaceae bacterium]